MTTIQVQKHGLSCTERGPGPAYKLPSLMGFDKHDPSRQKSPAFTIKSRPKDVDYTGSPGPAYNVYQMTRRGIEKPSGFSIAGRWNNLIEIGSGPGPGAYQPEKCPPMNHTKRSPSFSLLPPRRPKFIADDTPGPNTYIIPSCLGPEIPHKKTSGAFTIGERTWVDKRPDKLPGPGDYGRPNYDVVKKRYPAFTLKSRHQFFDQPGGPGPIYNPTFNPGKSQPMFSFGVRYSDCTSIPFMENNED